MRDVNIVIFGETGSGKSLLGSRIVDPCRVQIPMPFPSSPAYDSGTYTVAEETFVRADVRYHIFDTPGFSTDSAETFTAEGWQGYPMTQENIARYINDRLAQQGLKIHLFILVVRSSRTRASDGFKTMMREMKRYFPYPSLTQNLCVVVTQWGRHEDAISTQAHAAEQAVTSRRDVLDNVKMALRNSDFPTAAVVFESVELQHLLPTRAVNFAHARQNELRSMSRRSLPRRVSVRLTQAIRKASGSQQNLKDGYSSEAEEEVVLRRSPAQGGVGSATLSTSVSIARDFLYKALEAAGRAGTEDYEDFRVMRRLILQIAREGKTATVPEASCIIS